MRCLTPRMLAPLIRSDQRYFQSVSTRPRAFGCTPQKISNGEELSACELNCGRTRRAHTERYRAEWAIHAATIRGRGMDAAAARRRRRQRRGPGCQRPADLE